MKFTFEELQERIIALLVAKGLNHICAEAAALGMITADMYGITTHGTAMLPSHLKRIEQGGYNLNPTFPIIKESPAVAIIDAENSIGFASAVFCMRLAMERCREHGMYTVFSRHSNAYGAASSYSLLAAEEGLIGITCSNAPPAMAPIGGKDKLLGTNPLSAVFATGDNNPIIIDMATSKVAKSKFLQAKREGRLLPDGWALDNDGNPTNDPDAAIQGLVCPMEGFKGYGLALMIDVMSGMLSGAACQDKVGRFYDPQGLSMNVGHIFMAFDPQYFLGSVYYEQIQQYKKNIRMSARASIGEGVAIPGDDKLLHKLKCIEDGGITITDEVASLLTN